MEVAAWVAGDVVATTAEVVGALVEAPVEAPVPDPVEEAPELVGFFPTQLVSATKYC